MRPGDCEQLDDYLDGDLAQHDARAFERHVARCAACGRAVRQSTGLAHLLARAYQTNINETQPQPAIRQEAKRGRIAACLAALAATVLAWATWSLFLGDDAHPMPERSHIAQPSQARADHSAGTSEPARTSPRADVRVVNDQEILAIPIQSQHENVTIVWMYPTVRSEAGETSVFGHLK